MSYVVFLPHLRVCVFSGENKDTHIVPSVVSVCLVCMTTDLATFLVLSETHLLWL